MKTNKTELSMNELDQVNGGWELWDTIMIKLAPIARSVQKIFEPSTKKSNDEKESTEVKRKGHHRPI